MFTNNLIKKAKFSTKAFEKLYLKYVTQVYRYIEFRCNNALDAEDLTSKVWEIVIKNISTLKSNHVFAFKAWLYQIIKNTLKQYYRANEKAKIAYEFPASLNEEPYEDLVEGIKSKNQIDQII